MSYSNAEKLIELCIALGQSKMGMTISEIAERFHVTRRTAERMRDALERLFPSLACKRDHEGLKRWFLPDDVVQPLVRFDAADFAALKASEDMLRRANRSEDASRISQLGEKLRTALSSRAKSRIEPDLEALMQSEGIALRPGPVVRIDPVALDNIRTAILSSRRIRCDLRLQSGRTIEDARLEPYGLLYGLRPYLLAARAGGSGVKQYRLQSISGIALTDDAFERDPGFDIVTFSRGAFGVFQEEPVDVEWHFRPEAAAEAADYVFHPSQELERSADGGLRVRFRAGGLLEMAWHLATWGNAVTVIQPEDFWQRVHEIQVGRWTAVPGETDGEP
ncbi:helix-turn-helix transcriptional regulator [Gellertiella hungarica]|uniref:Putative DNA-binding transcriptional regulator YafY n=1 Tax=Gellertiella hungarica TaxID=1572859 RepID=A0A7W6NKH6_9HYPH|nr:WYL domain-containing protein [Gellertiella hungarica]MBB4064405.1 putative DNA-binding transcriptional regulator YafY [Gellertiella hungarica]